MVKNVCKILLQTLQCKYNLKKLHKTRNNFASCDRVAFAEASGSHARLHERGCHLPVPHRKQAAAFRQSEPTAKAGQLPEIQRFPIHSPRPFKPIHPARPPRVQTSTPTGRPAPPQQTLSLTSRPHRSRIPTCSGSAHPHRRSNAAFTHAIQPSPESRPPLPREQNYTLLAFKICRCDFPLFSHAR